MYEILVSSKWEPGRSAIDGFKNVRYMVEGSYFCLSMKKEWKQDWGTCARNPLMGYLINYSQYWLGKWRKFLTWNRLKEISRIRTITEPKSTLWGLRGSNEDVVPIGRACNILIFSASECNTIVVGSRTRSNIVEVQTRDTDGSRWRRKLLFLAIKVLLNSFWASSSPGFLIACGHLTKW